MNPTLLSIFCGLLLALSAFSIDIMLPAFSEMAVGLDSPIELVQATVPAFSFPLAVSQLFYGPASDRYGRKPTLATGLTIFLLGAVIVSVAPSIEWVLAGRALQGAGAGAGSVVSRAVLRDRYSGNALAGAMAFAMAVFAVGPIIAPLSGVWLTALGSWRYIFGAMVLAGAGMLAMNLFWFRETLEQIDPDALRPRRLIAAFLEVARHPQSRYFLIFASAAYCALLSLVSNAPRIYKSAFGINDVEFAMLFASTGIGIFVGQNMNRWLLPRMGILNTLRLASLILLITCATALVLQWNGSLTKYLFTGLMFAFNTSFLVVVSNSTALIIDPHKRIAGLASAFFGFCTLATAAIYVSLTFVLFDGNLLWWAIGMTAMTGLSFLGYLFARPKRIQMGG